MWRVAFEEQIRQLRFRCSYDRTRMIERIVEEWLDVQTSLRDLAVAAVPRAPERPKPIVLPPPVDPHAHVAGWGLDTPVVPVHTTLTPAHSSVAIPTPPPRGAIAALTANSELEYLRSVEVGLRVQVKSLELERRDRALHLADMEEHWQTLGSENISTIRRLEQQVTGLTRDFDKLEDECLLLRKRLAAVEHLEELLNVSTRDWGVQTDPPDLADFEMDAEPVAKPDKAPPIKPPPLQGSNVCVYVYAFVRLCVCSS
jgi:hypothetical protein